MRSERLIECSGIRTKLRMRDLEDVLCAHPTCRRFPLVVRFEVPVALHRKCFERLLASRSPNPDVDLVAPSVAPLLKFLLFRDVGQQKVFRFVALRAAETDLREQYVLKTRRRVVRRLQLTERAPHRAFFRNNDLSGRSFSYSLVFGGRLDTRRKSEQSLNGVAGELEFQVPAEEAVAVLTNAVEDRAIFERAERLR
jgi:hypothetical protein